ncbi:MAG: BadF/BadG/BcrA/BcrD ATPase family protein [Candidatus Eisenbacteria bacterium]
MEPRLAERDWRIGCDVGSTAVKVVLLGADGRECVWRSYRRHGTRQAVAVVRLLRELDAERPGALERARLFFTGNGGRTLAQRSHAGFVQEVNAVAEATERLYPETGCIVDLGGQDAKIIHWQKDARTGRRRKFFSMNDKCAGGTGSIIDRIAAKVGLSSAALGQIRCLRPSVHRVAARCGVFAETDVNSLQKQGIPAEELIHALFEAIVQQNLSVLARGVTLRPPVLLLGGPHAFLPGLVDTWRRELAALWDERGIARPAGEESAIAVPEEACFFAALGCVPGAGAPAPAGGEISAAEALSALEAFLHTRASEVGAPPLLHSEHERREIAALARQAGPRGFGPARGPHEVILGLDAGSTSTKAVALDVEGNLLAKAYRLSGGDPLRDAQAVLGEIARQAECAGTRLEVRGFGVTGYAKDLLGTLLGADLILVETVAHARSALTIRPDAEVIVDVGGQDIKVLILREGRVRDFRLNSQCSAGNGYFLQSTAARFEIPLDDFAATAFCASRCPEFHFGCAVFLESDIVNFQQLGWAPGEILAGLARVLPKNVWLYVVGEPNLARLGRIFILQGGTQRNLAAVKAQVDFIRGRVPQADVHVHPHAGEAGAIGVALEILERGLWRSRSHFPGLRTACDMEVRERSELASRCPGCPNRCARTVLEARSPGRDFRRFVVAPCEVGRRLALEEGEREEEGAAALRSGSDPGPEAASGVPRAPDFAAQAARIAFSRNPHLSPLPSTGPGNNGRRWGRRARHRRAGERDRIRIGLPRALNLHQVAPYFIAYMRALGLGPEQIIISRPTTESLFRRGSRRGAIDTCYPSKVALAQVHELIQPPRADWIFFPILVNLPAQLHPVVDAWVCPTSQATPEVVKAAFLREEDLFARQGLRYFDPVFHMGEPRLFEREMHRFWGPLLGVGAKENRLALEQGAGALEHALERLRARALLEIHRLELERRVGIVALGRPYHDDPGLNHGILRDLNHRGYPIFTVGSLPRHPDFLQRLFGEEIDRGAIRGPFDISDVWKNSFSANSNQKVWAAKVVARHPNLVALDLSSFRCGHDAPILATVEAILEAAGTPYFTFHDIDENRPSGAIRLRVETIDYSLREYERRALGRSERSRERPKVMSESGRRDRALASPMARV